MKYDIYIAKININLIIIILFFSVLSIKAEEVPGPEGEQIIRQHFFKKNGKVSRIIATRYNVYSSHYSFSEGWSRAKRMFSVPNGKRIIDASGKFADAEEKKTYCILLDDGSIYEFKYKAQNDYFEGMPKIIFPPASPTEQLNYRNILVSDIFLVICNNVIFQNKLDGKGWFADSIGISNLTINSIAFNSLGELFAGTNKGLYRKIGNRFEKINTVDTFNVLTLFNDRWGKLHINLYNRTTMVSLDTGKTFIHDSAGIGSRYVVRFGDDRWGNVYAITLTQYVNRIYKKSANTDWVRIDTNLTNYLGFYSSYNDIGGETTLEVSAYYGSYSSRDDGITWFTSNAGILAEDIFKLLILNNGKMFAYTILGIFKKDIDSAEWTKIFPQSGISSNYFLMNDKNNILYTQINRTGQQAQGNIYKSQDLGENWEIDTTGIYILPRGYTGYSQLFIDDDGIQHYANSYVYGASTNYFKIYEKKSSDIWKIDTSGLNLPGILTSHLYTIGSFAQNGNDLYVSGALWDYVSNTSIFRNGLLFKRKLNESVWSIDTLGIGNDAIYSIAFDDNGNMIAGTLALDGKISRILKKKDNKWNSINVPPAAATDVRALAIDTSGTLWAVFNNTSFTSTMNRGIYATDDNGKTWEYAGFDSVIVRGLVTYGSKIYAYTGRGIHTLTKAPFKQAVIEINPQYIDFGKVKPGARVDTIVSIKNIGEDTLRITNITYNSTFSPSRTKFNIAPGASENLLISFIPLSVMKYSFRMRIFSNTYPDSILLNGEGILTDSSAKITLSEKSINFGKVRSGQSKDTTVTITNTGLETLNVYNIISSTTVFTAQERTFEVPANMSKQVSLRFSPTSVRAYSGYLYIQSNVLPDTIWLKGEGIEAAAPKLSLSLKSIDFGKVEVGQSKDTTVVFKNIGTDTLRVSYVRTFSESFLTSHHQFRLAPEEEILVTLTFKPQDEKVYSDNFAIVSNASPDTIFVKGEGYYFVNVNDLMADNTHYIVYPNPVLSKLFVKNNDNFSKLDKIKIHSIIGVEILSIENIDINNQNQFFEIDISNLSKGTYFLTILSNKTKSVHLIQIIK